MNALTTLLFPLLAALPQGPDEALATYQLDGKTLPVTRTDVALEMAFHLRRRDRGQQAVEQLVAVAITRKAAEDRKLMPSEADVRAFWNDLQAQLRAAGRRPEDIPAVRNTGEAQWLADLAVQLAQKRVVRQELGLKSDEEVSGDMLNLWLQEQRKQALVVTDPDLLPAGSAARVGSADIPLIELGALLLRTAEDEERDRFVKQVVYLAALESAARKEGVQVTAADLDAAVKKHKDDAAKDPRYSGVTYGNLLKAEGLSEQSIRDLRVFRGQILLDKLARARCRDEDLAAEIAKDRQGVLDRHGARRRLGLIYLRAIDVPKPLVPRDFAAAERELEACPLGLACDAAIIDIHAETSSEKCAMGHFADGRASLVVGTHTHIPTADAQILPGGTAFQSDAGMTGDYDSVIGMNKAEPLNRFTRRIPSGRFEPADGPATLCGVAVETNANGLATMIAPVRLGGRLKPALPDEWE